MKRILFLLIVLFSTLSLTSYAATKGKCGDNVRWQFDKKTGVLTISGKGPMADYFHNTPWKSKEKDIKSVIIEDGVTSIGNHAFPYCTNLETISIPNSVITIGEWSFAACQHLSSVTLPDKVSKIGKYAFTSCVRLKSIVIPEQVKMIEEGTFKYCRNLTSIKLPNNIHGFQTEAFSECVNLKSITIPNTIYRSIGENAFLNCKINEIHYNGTIEDWCQKGWNAKDICEKYGKYSLYFYNEKVTSIIIPNDKDFIKISKSTFESCESITSVEIPGSVKVIGEYAFKNCPNLSTVVIHDGVMKISTNAFYYCSNLTSVVIPQSVTTIDQEAFSNYDKLTIYTASAFDFSQAKISKARIVRGDESQLMYYAPFSVYARDYVEKGINKWQQRDEFERTAAWQKRVNEQSRQQKIQSLVEEAEQKYIAFHIQGEKAEVTLGKYDADNEVYALNDSRYGQIYMAIPFNEAKNLKEHWNKKKISRQLQINDDKIVLSALTISLPNGKTYTYRNTDAVSYNLADADYHFDPIELNLPKTTASQPQPGQQHITTTKVQIGKSAVDTDIPATNATSPNTFAIIFANEDYKNVAPVPFAKNDGTTFQKYCQKTLGIPTSNIHYVENASFNDIRIQLAWLKDVCDAFEGKASVIVYYAGHGIPDEASKSAYLLPVDGDGRYVQSAYNVDELYQKLGALNAKSVTVFLDACFSGSKREQGMLTSARGIAVKAKSGVPQGKMVVFSAAQGDETAYPNTDEQHGMFTYYLLKKLQETQGNVTLQDLGDYITSNVRQQSIVKNGKSQTPCVTPSLSVSSEWQKWKLR